MPRISILGFDPQHQIDGNLLLIIINSMVENIFVPQLFITLMLYFFQNIFGLPHFWPLLVVLRDHSWIGLEDHMWYWE